MTEKKQVALFVFNGDPMCFIHVLLNALDMDARGAKVRIVVEGSAVKLVPAMAAADHPLHGLWEKVKAAGLVAGACEACSRKLNTLEAVVAQGLERLNDMNGHPSMAGFRERGCEIITF